jgi:ubiquinone/menaquinone biosynthesis C-methylase UbiE
MSAYASLASAYDALTGDVDYPRRADFVEKLFRRSRIPVHTVLDLACGTGSMTELFTQRGYEVIAVDQSEDMLMEAREKAQDLPGVPPLFLCQSMPELDLYGTVEAAMCCLDSLNYLTRPQDVRRTFDRLRLFIAPGGVLVFDISTVYKLQNLDGQVFLDETEDTYCVWRADYQKRSRICSYGLDLFTRRPDGSWRRDGEEHRQRGYEVEELKTWLRDAGFGRIRTYGDCRMSGPREDEQRIYFAAVRE